MLYEAERQQVVDTCLEMVAKNLVVGTAGNVSVRVGDHVVMSPSAVPYDTMTAEDVAVVDMDGNQLEGKYKPSSECPLHLSVYRATDAGAITHNHAPASTAMGLVVDEIPISHYYSTMFGGAIRVAPYATFGTDELAENVTNALNGRLGALMANHGAITIGPDLAAALDKLPYLEYICDIELRALWTGRAVKLLTDEQVAEASSGIKGYTAHAANEG
ncbi:MAG: class II aldolase/adducin family protein [Ancrocorticia sp.]|uniref:class II aldolase/adducin family protein n=1 Tax=Ancrocorticia sp. TaxID=2593684 RepID=UPI003F914D80